MKKFISIISLIAFVFSLCSSSAYAEDEQATTLSMATTVLDDLDEPVLDPNMVFNLDFSAYDINQGAGARGLKNTVAGENITAEFYVPNTTEIERKTIADVDALEVRKEYIRVLSSDGSAFGGKDVTIETWVYKHDFTYSAPIIWDFFKLTRTNDEQSNELGLRLNAKKSNEAQSIRLHPTFLGMNADPATEYGYCYDDIHTADAWEHIVITRSYGADNKTATVKMYVNGKLKKEHTAVATEAFTSTQGLYIGKSSLSLNAAFGAFRVYNKVLDSTEVSENFAAEKDAYGVVEQPEEPENPDNPDNPDNPNEPDNPDNPDDPDEPEIPDEPDVPVGPAEPIAPNSVVLDLNWDNYDPGSSAENKGMSNDGSTNITVGYNPKGAPKIDTISTYQGNKKVLKFNSRGEILALGIAIDMENAVSTSSATMEMWVKKDMFETATGDRDFGSMFQLCGGTNTGDRQMRWYIAKGQGNGNEIEFRVCNTDANSATQSEKYNYNDYHTADAWEHMVMTLSIDGSKNATGCLYVNGVLKKELKIANQNTVDCNKILLGGYDLMWDIDANMLIGEFKVYNTALTYAQVKQNFIDAKGLYSETPQINRTEIEEVQEYTTQTIEVKFDRDVAAFATTDKLYIENEEKGKINAVIESINTQENTVTLKLTEMLVPGEEYIIRIVKDPTKAPTLFDDEVSFVVAELDATPEFSYEDVEDILTIDVEFDAVRADGITCQVLVVVYDDTGRVVNVANTFDEITIADDDSICQIEIDSSGFESGYTVKTFVWDCSGLAPIPVMNKTIEY